ncbi:MAG: SGNH/GDSL hydrolase family protein [Candidatus Nanopelagicaceae bacterium]|nr:SGNH/GDSL hydrolase family protein [Candidatus Nanopelagicaceae bacterium]
MSKLTVFIGDSVTDCGRLIEPPFGDGYVFNIAQSGRLAGEIINVGISGHRLVDLENRWNTDVLAHNPTLVSVAIGINDTWRRYDDNDPTSVEDFEDRYRRVLTATKAHGNPDLVLCEPFLLEVRDEMNSWREDLDPKIAVVHKMAAEFGAKLVPFDQHFKAKAKELPMVELADDGIHPSKVGHQIMADLWLRTVGL